MSKNLLRDIRKLTIDERMILVAIIKACTNEDRVTLATLPLFPKEEALYHLKRYIFYVDFSVAKRIYRKLKPWWWVPEMDTIVFMAVCMILSVGITLSVFSLLEAK